MVAQFTREQLLEMLAKLDAKPEGPPECAGCSAPLTPEEFECSYCGRQVEQLPEEPPDIRKTNASDDICQACQQVHEKDPYKPMKCRCQKCGNIGLVGMSTFDPVLGVGIVCRSCLTGVPAQDLSTPLPWHT